MRVLVIDDNEELAVGIAEILQIKDHEPYTATNGQEGLEIAIANQPDIIFCDMQMPIMDGYETLCEIRRHPATANTPFILLTGRILTNSWEKFEAAGANSWLEKPFAYDIFFNIIDSYHP